MNTEYLYVSNIPSNIKPVLLLHDLNNKWARMLYLENSFSGMRDALIYNPVKSLDELTIGVEKLRIRELDGTKNLIVNYVFFPPANVFLTTMIPDGASMLSYILLENLHKDVSPPEIIADLPLQPSDLKIWDIPERSDKCLLLKLPGTCSNPMRSFILGTLRSRMVRGFYPKVSELIICENPILGTSMVPRSLRLLDSGESYQSNFFYLHEIPSRLTVKMLVETTKSENIKGGRVFFLETYGNMKYGFLYVPKSLPNDRFMALYNKLSHEEFQTSSGDNEGIKVCQVWFQPDGAEPPPARISPRAMSGAVSQDQDLSGEEAEADDDIQLSYFVYISGVPATVTPQQLMFGCPVRNAKLSLFSVNEMDTQIGFLLLRGLSEMDSVRAISHFRGLSFNGCNLEVHEIYLRCRQQDLRRQLNPPSHPYYLLPREKTFLSSNSSTVQQQLQQNNILAAALSSSNGNAGANGNSSSSVSATAAALINAALLLQQQQQQQQQHNNQVSSSTSNSAATVALRLMKSLTDGLTGIQTSSLLPALTAPTGGLALATTSSSSRKRINNNITILAGANEYDQEIVDVGTNFPACTTTNSSSADVYGKPTQLPPDEFSLMKTEFLCVDNLPRNVGMAALLFNIGKVSDGAVMMPSVGSSKAFIYFPNCAEEEWTDIINSLLRKNFNGRQPLVNEVYLQTDELTNPDSNKLIVDISMVFAYNIANSVELGDIYHLDTNYVAHADLLETTNGSKSAFILLKSNTTESEATNFIHNIRKSYIQGKPLYADRIKLAPVRLVHARTNQGTDDVSCDPKLEPEEMIGLQTKSTSIISFKKTRRG